MKYMEPKEFVDMAMCIIGDNQKYEDEIVIIEKKPFAACNDFQITRKSMPHISKDLTVTNPVTMVYDGKIIRHHGEHIYLVEHMESLVNKINQSSI